MSDQGQVSRPRFAWHELLKPVAPPPPPPEKADVLFEGGKQVHRKLEAIIGEAHLVEQEMVYKDPSLPFDIAYHPDVLRQELGVDGAITTFVYEIKPVVWFLRNRTYCEAQAGGYAHFTGAREVLFVLYWRPDPDGEIQSLSVLEAHRVPWEGLKAVALRAYGQMQR